MIHVKRDNPNSLTDLIIGDGINQSIFGEDGKLHFEGEARPVKLQVIHTLQCRSSHLNPVSLTALTESNGIATDGLDTSAGATRRIEVIGVDGGVNVKGRLKAAYSRQNTTSIACMIKIKLNTTNATWEQAGEWRLILDFLTSDCLTGKFTIFMPAFSIMEYSSYEVYVTCDGATYYAKTAYGFDRSLAGPSAATENFSNNETAGSDVVVEVTSTAGFYDGNLVLVSDSENSEWTRIKEVITDTSIEVIELVNSYTTANGAKLSQINFTKTVATRPIQRGLFKAMEFRADENSGILFQAPLPQELDTTADIPVVLQYLPTADNPSSHVTKWKIQYVLKGLGEDLPESYQYANLAYADIVSPATKGNNIAVLFTLPYAANFAGKYILAMSLTRLGEDAGDTYTGNMKFIALALQQTTYRMGYEVP